jgi:hypothetical protein
MKILNSLDQQKRRIKVPLRENKTTGRKNSKTNNQVGPLQGWLVTNLWWRTNAKGQYWTKFAISTPNTHPKTASVKKGKEKLRQSSEFSVRNSETTWCGQEKALRICEWSMRASSSCLSSRSTNGGGTKLARGPKKPTERLEDPPVCKRSEKKMKIATSKTALKQMMKTVRW